MDQPLAAPTPALADAPRPRRRSLLGFVVSVGALALALRIFIFAPFNIPSESMLPTLYVGDFLVVTKWSYGWSWASFVLFDPPLHGRLLGRLPARGDVVVFKAPPLDRVDYVKRVIGLPGDTVQLRHGRVILNGVEIPRRRTADFVIAATDNYNCPDEFAERRGRARYCRYARFIETLPDGVSYPVLDRGPTLADDTPLFTVPAGHLFMMGDNRDDSADSRFAAVPGQGIGYVPVDNVEGRAARIFYSTDGGARWYQPWTWFTSARWRRIGRAL